MSFNRVIKACLLLACVVAQDPEAAGDDADDGAKSVKVLPHGEATTDHHRSHHRHHHIKDHTPVLQFTRHRSTRSIAAESIALSHGKPAKPAAAVTTTKKFSGCSASGEGCGELQGGSSTSEPPRIAGQIGGFHVKPVQELVAESEESDHPHSHHKHHQKAHHKKHSKTAAGKVSVPAAKAAPSAPSAEIKPMAIDKNHEIQDPKDAQHVPMSYDRVAAPPAPTEYAATTAAPAAAAPSAHKTHHHHPAHKTHHPAHDVNVDPTKSQDVENKATTSEDQTLVGKSKTTDFEAPAATPSEAHKAQQASDAEWVADREEKVQQAKAIAPKAGPAHKAHHKAHQKAHQKKKHPYNYAEHGPPTDERSLSEVPHRERLVRSEPKAAHH